MRRHQATWGGHDGYFKVCCGSQRSARGCNGVQAWATAITPNTGLNGKRWADVDRRHRDSQGRAKQRLYCGFLQALLAGKLRQAFHAWQGRRAGDDVEIAAQRHHLQERVLRAQSGKVLPLGLEGFSRQDLGKVPPIGAGVGERSG